MEHKEMSFLCSFPTSSLQPSFQIYLHFRKMFSVTAFEKKKKNTIACKKKIDSFYNIAS